MAKKKKILATDNVNTIIASKNVAAVELGRLGGLKGGKARALALSPKRRSEIARNAANKRWGKG
ncbi:MAG: hypothetical protein ABIN36_13740 [Ferruginibacter sp.]